MLKLPSNPITKRCTSHPFLPQIIANKTNALFLSTLRPSIERLIERATSLLVPEPSTRPEKIGRFWYYQRIDKKFPVFCRVPHLIVGSPKQQEDEKILQVASLANFSATGVVDVVACNMHPEDEILGLIADFSGDEEYEFMVKSIGKQDDRIIIRLPLIRSFEFLDFRGPRGEYFAVIVEMDKTSKRSIAASLISFDCCGNVFSRRKILKAHNDVAYVDVVKSKDKKWIFLSSSTKEEGRVWGMRAGDPQVCDSPDRPVCLLPIAISSPGEEVWCETRDETLFVFSRVGSAFRIFTAPIEMVSSSGPYGGQKESKGPVFSEIFAPVDFIPKDVDMFREGLAIYGHDTEGTNKVTVLKFETSGDVNHSSAIVSKILSTPSAPTLMNCSLRPGLNGDYEATHANLEISSPIDPGTNLAVDLRTGKLVHAHSREFQSGRKADAIISQIRVESNESTSAMCSRSSPTVTIFSPVHSFRSRVVQSLTRPRPLPTLIHVYGAYGERLFPSFSLATAALLSKGWRVAYANVNSSPGLKNKEAAVEEFKSCCDALVTGDWSTRSGLSAHAVSAGGAILGSALNRWGTDLIGGKAVLRMPFLDIHASLADPELPLRLLERAEWGEANETLKSFSPADNVKTENFQYPKTLLTCAMDDARVPIQGTLRFAEKMAKANPDGFFCRVLQSGGHFGLGEGLETEMSEVAFLLHDTE